MAFKKTLSIGFLVFLAGLFLVACSNSSSSGGLSGGGTVPTGPGGAGSGVPSSVELTSTGASLGPSSDTLVFATVTDQAGNPVPNATVSFTFLTGSNLGTLSPSSGKTDANGVASTTFTSGSTAGFVQIKGEVNIVSGTIESGILLISISTIGSVQLVGADPPVIGLQGSGQVQTSTVTFKVVDQLGNPVPDTTVVTFSIIGPGGGETFFPDTTNTANGLASLVLASGTKAGPVTITVTATLGPTTISNTITPLSIGGGVADAKFLSLGASVLNLGSGAPNVQLLDVTTDIECKMADQFGSTNILQGTSASFFTEAGALVASDITGNFDVPVTGDNTPVPAQDGIAAVELRTQNPPPDPLTSGERHPENGRVTVMCETGGQEHFTDNNSNGVFDSGDTFSAAEDDLPEPFLDRNEDGTRNPGEYFDDVNQNGVWDAGNSKWDSNTKIWRSMVVVFSGFPENIELVTSTSDPQVCVSDVNGNPIMGESAVEIAMPPGESVVVPGTGQTAPTSTATIAIGDQLFPDINPDSGEPAGTCITFLPSSSGISVTVFVKWNVPGFATQTNSATFLLP